MYSIQITRNKTSMWLVSSLPIITLQTFPKLWECIEGKGWNCSHVKNSLWLVFCVDDLHRSSYFVRMKQPPVWEFQVKTQWQHFSIKCSISPVLVHFTLELFLIYQMRIYSKHFCFKRTQNSIVVSRNFLLVIRSS